MAYVAVNKDGGEVIFEDAPQFTTQTFPGRVKEGAMIWLDGKQQMFIRDNRKYHPYSKTMRVRDLQTQRTYDVLVSNFTVVVVCEDHWYCEEWSGDGKNYGINLPIGSIEKLIGKVLTWGDDSVELKLPDGYTRSVEPCYACKTTPGYPFTAAEEKLGGGDKAMECNYCPVCGRKMKKNG